MSFSSDAAVLYGFKLPKTIELEGAGRSSDEWAEAMRFRVLKLFHAGSGDDWEDFVGFSPVELNDYTRQDASAAFGATLPDIQEFNDDHPTLAAELAQAAEALGGRIVPIWWLIASRG